MELFSCSLLVEPAEKGTAPFREFFVFWLRRNQLGLSESLIGQHLHAPGSKLLKLGMVIPPLIGNPYNYGHIKPYYEVHEFIPTIGKQWVFFSPQHTWRVDLCCLIRACYMYGM